MTEHRSGWVTFAGIMLLMAGILNVIYGIAAIGNSDFFVQNAHYVFSDLKTWGWVTLVIGVLQFLGALSLWRGGFYGRVVGIFGAGLGAIAALLSIPAYPFWSLAVFALCIVIIHQIAAHGTEGRGEHRAGPADAARDRQAMTTGSGPR
jgi:hypothetical protein